MANLLLGRGGRGADTQSQRLGLVGCLGNAGIGDGIGERHHVQRRLRQGAGLLVQPGIDRTGGGSQGPSPNPLTTRPPLGHVLPGLSLMLPGVGLPRRRRVVVGLFSCSAPFACEDRAVVRRGGATFGVRVLRVLLWLTHLPNHACALGFPSSDVSAAGPEHYQRYRHDDPLPVGSTSHPGTLCWGPHQRACVTFDQQPGGP